MQEDKTVSAGRRRWVRVVATATCAVSVGCAGVAPAGADSTSTVTSPYRSSVLTTDTGSDAGDGGQCSALHLVFVNGTLDSNPRFDPNQDQGFFAGVFDKITRRVNEGVVSDRSGGVAADASAAESARSTTAEPTAAGTTSSAVVGPGGSTTTAAPGAGTGRLRVSRSYVNYPATAGGAFFPGAPQANPGDATAYVDSMNIGVARANDQIHAVADRCPGTKIGLMGYSQGGEVVANVTKAIGAGRGPVPADRLALSVLFATPTRVAASPLQVAGHDSVGTGGVKEATRGLSAYPTPDGGGISGDKTGIAGFGAVADRVVSWCLNGDVVCGLPVDSTTARALVGIAEDTSVGDPVGTVKRLADGLGQALAVSDVDRLDAADVDFGDGGFTLRPVAGDSTGASRGAAQGGRTSARGGAVAGDGGEMIGRFISSVTKTSVALDGGTSGRGKPPSTIGLPGMSDLRRAGGGLSDMAGQVGETVDGVKQGVSGRGNVAAGTTIEDRLVPAMADLGGMALGAAITTAKKTLRPENLAAIGAAGATGGVPAAGAVALAKFSEAGLDLIKPENVSVFTRRAMESLNRSGLGVADIAKLAVELSRWKSLNEHTSYGTRPIMADGRTAVAASVDWVVAAAEQAGGFTATREPGTGRDSGVTGEAVTPVRFDSQAARKAVDGVSVAGGMRSSVSGSSETPTVGGRSARVSESGSTAAVDRQGTGVDDGESEPMRTAGEE
ncbi:cutinase family protein [Corynebacterium bovis]|uniref:cutinase family protein n=1 Tax=Corynebacterium bovis TaxID=36808 RepID=UPI0031391E51